MSRVVVGNSSADLDSCASAVGLALLLTRVTGETWTPVVNCAAGDMDMRREQTYWLEKCRVKNLTFADCVDWNTVVQIVLVDHNDISRSLEHVASKVVGIVDHHTDTQQLLTELPTITMIDQDSKVDLPRIRLITGPSVGSCSSLVLTLWYASTASITYHTALLLAGAIIRDTKGLRHDLKGTRWTDVDGLAFYWLSHMFDAFPEEKSIKKELKAIRDDRSLYQSTPLSRLLTMDMKTFSYGERLVVFSSFPLALTELFAERDDCEQAWREHLADQGASIAILMGHGKDFREVGIIADGALTSRLTAHLSKSCGAAFVPRGDVGQLRLFRHNTMTATRKVLEPWVRDFFAVMDA